MAFCTNKPDETMQLAPSIPYSPERVDLEKVLHDKVSRNKLIQTMARSEENKSHVLPLRYCVSADEYQCTKDPIEKKQKARKMVAVFVQNGSMFQLQNIPQDLKKQLLAEKFLAIALAREFYAQELALDSTVADTIRDLNLV